jgi:hypothetical protein
MQNSEDLNESSKNNLVQVFFLRCIVQNV